MSVVIPVRNAAATLRDQLQALGRQTYCAPWEIVLSDNGSTDDTVLKARESAPAGIDLRVIDASARPGSSFARNRGAEEGVRGARLCCRRAAFCRTRLRAISA
jgi:glycosyltransferase involved in cell wall biosynthesis